MKIILRDLDDGELEQLFVWEQHPAAVEMAAFTRADPSDRNAFDAHYERIRADPTVMLRAIDDGDGLVGTIASFTMEGDHEITYWIDPARWGEGIASAALAAFLTVELTRPLHARVAEHNLASAKVLARAGFVELGSETSFADGVGRDIVEHIYRLEGKAVPTPLVRSHEGVVEMNIVTLRGQLMCKNASEIAVVAQFLPAHIELTRAEPGCISFEVNPSDDPSVWSVSEQFQDAASFELHQARVKASEWGRATAGIERRYTVTGLGEPWRRTASPSNRDS